MPINSRTLSVTLSLFLSSLFFGGCSESVSLVAASDPSFGLIGESVSDYGYPKEAGYLYVYKNTLSSWVNGPSNAPTVSVGAHDSLFTLGYQGVLSPTGDSLFAYRIKYHVKSTAAGRPLVSLRYLPTSGDTVGAFIECASSILGEIDPTTPASCAVNLDTLSGAVGGRAKEQMDYFGQSGSTVWQIDTIFFTADDQSFVMWEYTAENSLRANKNVFVSYPSVNDTWTYAIAGSSTYHKAVSLNASVSVLDTTLTSISIKVTSPSLDLPLSVYRYYGRSKGLLRETNEWWSTTNGTDRIKKSLIREISVIVKDWDQVD